MIRAYTLGAAPRVSNAPLPHEGMHHGSEPFCPVEVDPAWCVLRPFCPNVAKPNARGYCRKHWEEWKREAAQSPCDECGEPVKYRSKTLGNLCTSHYYRAYRRSKKDGERPDQKFYRANREERKRQVKEWQDANPERVARYLLASLENARMNRRSASLQKR